MISGTLNVEDCKTISHGRVSGHDTKHHFFNRGVMDGKAEEESPGKTGSEDSNCKFSNAAKCCSGIKNIEYRK